MIWTPPIVIGENHDTSFENALKHAQCSSLSNHEVSYKKYAAIMDLSSFTDKQL